VGATFFEVGIEERYFNYLVRVWTQPVLWLLVAMLLGGFRARQIEQRNDLLRQAENLRVRGMTLLDYANNLRARCSMLERRIATHSSSDAGILLGALARLDEAKAGRWADALHAALDAAFPQSQFSLYAADPGTARLILTHGQPEGRQRSAAAPEIAGGHPLFALVAGAGRAAIVLEPADDAALRGLGVAAVPIFSTAPREPSRVIGILKADSLPPGQIDRTTTRRLAVIAAHLAPIVESGLVMPVVGDASVVGAERTAGSAGEDIPTLRKWRLLKWLPGGRPPSSPTAGGDDD